ncbi:MAG: FAD-dependent oxidoreductase [Alphaproteobacteria bacterium]|nr:FAD-dependent oxidoreductase [Alphaproteobacteria bacterium]
MAKVAIVGAGLAGMTAATRLAEAGHEIEVFEADEEIGGRTRSLPFGDHWINLGAQYLAGDETPAMRLARKYDVPVAALSEPAIAVHRRSRTVVARSLPALLWRLPLSLAGRLSILRCGLRLERLRAGLAHLSRASMRELDARAFGELIDGAHPEARDLFRSMAVRMACGEPEQMSAFLGLSWTPGFLRPRIPGAPDLQRISVIVGGTGRLAQILASTLPRTPRLLAPVTVVRSQHRGVTIETESGMHAADAAVISTPAPVAAKIAVDLDAGLRSRLATVHYGSFILVAFAFAQPPPVPWDRVYAVQVIEPPFHAAINETWPLQESGTPVSTTIVKMMLGGRHAQDMMANPDQALFAQALNALRRISPGLVGEPRSGWIKRWPLGLPFWTPGQLSRGRLQIDHGAVQLAGDYTDYPNTQGAVKSGHLAAENLIMRYR